MYGNTYDIATPFNSLIQEIVEEAQAAKTVPDFETSVARFAALLND